MVRLPKGGIAISGPGYLGVFSPMPWVFVTIVVPYLHDPYQAHPGMYSLEQIYSLLEVFSCVSPEAAWGHLTPMFRGILFGSLGFLLLFS